MTTAPIRVVLVDDHAVIRAGFRTILSAEPDIVVVGEAATGTDAVAVVADVDPDVVCMDVQMPDMDGITATKALVSDPTVQAAVVIVTTFNDEGYLFDALAAGASGFLLKNAGPEELVSAVRVASHGDALLAPEVTRRVIERFAATRTSASTAAAPVGPAAVDPDRITVELTERETEVLRLVARAMSNAEIAGELFIGEATVKTHMSNLLQKIGARDRIAAVVYAHRHGLG